MTTRLTVHFTGLIGFIPESRLVLTHLGEERKRVNAFQVLMVHAHPHHGVPPHIPAIVGRVIDGEPQLKGVRESYMYKDPNEEERIYYRFSPLPKIEFLTIRLNGNEHKLKEMAVTDDFEKVVALDRLQRGAGDINKNYLSSNWPAKAPSDYPVLGGMRLSRGVLSTTVVAREQNGAGGEVVYGFKDDGGVVLKYGQVVAEEVSLSMSFTGSEVQIWSEQVGQSAKREFWFDRAVQHAEVWIKNLPEEDIEEKNDYKTLKEMLHFSDVYNISFSPGRRPHPVKVSLRGSLRIAEEVKDQDVNISNPRCPPAQFNATEVIV
jgi:hypothetical protein